MALFFKANKVNNQDSHSMPIKPFFEYKFPDKEYVFVQKKGQLRQAMTADEYNRQFNVSLQHGVFYESKQADRAKIVKEAMLQKTDQYQKNNQKLSTYLKNPKNYFSVCHLDDTCGYGLVANEYIPAGTVVGTYSGMLVMREENEDIAPLVERAYDMGYGQLSPIIYKDKKYYITLRAENVSDITRFAIHLPTQTEVWNLQHQLEPDIDAKNILTANIDFPVAIIDGAPIHYYVTTKSIQKGEVAGISYGSTYWNSRDKPHLLIREVECLRIAAFNKEFAQYEKQAGIQVKLNAPVVTRNAPKPSVLPALPSYLARPPLRQTASIQGDKPAPIPIPLINNSQLIQQILLRSKQRREDSMRIYSSKSAPSTRPKQPEATPDREQTSYAAYRILQQRKQAHREQTEKLALSAIAKPRWKM
jgi:hypothetical protein